MEMLFVSCVCLFSLLLVPVPADVRNGNLTEQRGMCNALGGGSENAHTHHNGEHIPEFRFPAIKPPYLKRLLKEGEIGGEHLECSLKQDFTWF